MIFIRHDDSLKESYAVYCVSRPRTGQADFFYKGPNSKYFKLCGQYKCLSELLHSATVNVKAAINNSE